MSPLAFSSWFAMHVRPLISRRQVLTRIRLACRDESLSPPGPSPGGRSQVVGPLRVEAAVFVSLLSFADSTCQGAVTKYVAESPWDGLAIQSQKSDWMANPSYGQTGRLFRASAKVAVLVVRLRHVAEYAPRSKRPCWKPVPRGNAFSASVVAVMDQWPLVPHASSSGEVSSSVWNGVRERKAEAWRRLVTLYGPVIYHWARQDQLHREDAADVVQEVFAAVHAHVEELPRPSPDNSLRRWLLDRKSVV